MELKIGAVELARALGRSQGIVERKSTMPVLSHVLLDAQKSGELILAATDLDVAVQSHHRCESVTKEGKVAVPARHLFDIVKALPEASALLRRVQNNYLEVRSGTAEFRLVGLPAEDFPALPRPEKVPFVQVNAADMLTLIERTSFAISTDETRYNLNGVFFEPQGERLRMVATDGHRLSLADVAAPGDFKLKKGVILPRKGLLELRKLLSEALEGGEAAPSAELGFVESSAIVRRAGVMLVMRLIEGMFPDYKQVIPKPGDKVVKVGRMRLLETLRRIALLASDKSHAVKLELAKGTLRVLSQNPDLGEGKEDVTVDYPGEPIQIGFNARYLIDVLQVLSSEDVTFELADDLSPGVLKPAGEEGYTAVVMPMRI